MWLVYALIGLALFAVPLYVAIQRSTELFVIEIDGKRVRLMRGRLPKRLLSELEDVVARSPVHGGQLRVIVDDGRPRVLPNANVPPGVAQQLRNVVGTFQVAQIRNGNVRR